MNKNYAENENTVFNYERTLHPSPTDQRPKSKTEKTFSLIGCSVND